MVGSKQPNSGPNATIIIATINDAGGMVPSVIIFKENRISEYRITHVKVVSGTKFAVTESFIMKGSLSVNYFRKFHQWLIDNDKTDGKLLVILLDDHASHTTMDMIRFAMANSLMIFQLPSDSLHVTEALSACAFGIFEGKSTDILRGRQ